MNDTYIEETQSEKLKFENKYRGISYLLKKLLKDGDITSEEYSDSLIEMERMKNKEINNNLIKSA